MNRYGLLVLMPLLLAATAPVPRTLKLDAADYPAAAGEAGIEGDVRLDLQIDEKGKVAGCTVTAGANLPAGLAADSCAIVAKRWRFDPARDDAGAKVPARLNYTIAWRIALPCPKPEAQTICVFL